jgi:type IV pilus assembly protein PilW
MIRTLSNSKGFSLIELLIAIAVFGIVVAGIIGAFTDQLRSHNTQQRILDMQQNARAAMYYMTRELKMAGLDPTGDANAGFVTTNRNLINFTMDFRGGFCEDEIAAGEAVDDDDDDGINNEGCNNLDDNGDGVFVDEPDEREWFDGDTADANEDVTYTLSNDADNDGECDGLPTENNDGTSCDLTRNGQILAMNIDALDFRYLGVDPAQAGCDTDCLLNAPVANPDNIRSVQISLIARGGRNVPALSYQVRDNILYRNQGGDIILPRQNDMFRRIFLTTEIQTRNLGLN